MQQIYSSFESAPVFNYLFSRVDNFHWYGVVYLFVQLGARQALAGVDSRDVAYAFVPCIYVTSIGASEALAAGHVLSSHVSLHMSAGRLQNWHYETHYESTGYGMRVSTITSIYLEVPK